MNRPLGIGMIGAGAMARAYCTCLRQMTGANLVAVACGGRAPELAAAFGVAWEESVESLLARTDVDAVVIATPERLHAAQTLAAAAAGKAVLVEKPMAPTVAECDAMIAACRAANVTLMVVKHWRYRGVHRRAVERIRSGEFGAVTRLENRTLTPRAASLATVAAKPFYLDPANGGLLMGWAVHNLDWIRSVAATDAISVKGWIESAEPPLLEGNLAATIQFGRGIEASLHVATNLPTDPGRDQVFRTIIHLERARLDLDGYGEFKIVANGRIEVAWAQPKFDPRDPGDPVRLEAYAMMLQSFVDSVRHRTAPPVSGQDGRAAVALFHAIRQASRMGERVILDR